MTPRKRALIYWRNGRAWGDFREWSDVGGRREPLVPHGERKATTDDATAQTVAAGRIEQLESHRRGRTISGLAHPSTLGTFAADHLIAKQRSGKVTDRWMRAAERQLQRACDFFGADRPLDAIGVADVRGWLTWLGALPGRRGETMRGGTLRHHVNTLSNLYRRAQAEGAVLPGFNPAAALMEKPTATTLEARWIEVHDGALILEAARRVKPGREDLSSPFAYPLIATFLLTGGRRSEILGLEVSDVSFDRRTITFRPNQFRRLKTETSRRAVPLWPQLEEILRAYVFGANGPPGRLLFPSLATGQEAMLTDVRKLLDRVTVRAGWPAGEITSKMFRHGYCAARLRTLEEGAPITTFAVGRELGHGGSALVTRIYGHLGSGPRSNVVEYRVEAFEQVLAERLAAVRGG